MATYLILNLCVVTIVVVVLKLRPKKPSKAWLFTLGALIALTAIFDSLIVSFDIVGYADDKILGTYIGAAPIEDFFYAILVALLIPTLWNKLGDKHV
jgi:lycopene cyclase domain-containing protein